MAEPYISVALVPLLPSVTLMYFRAAASEHRSVGERELLRRLARMVGPFYVLYYKPQALEAREEQAAEMKLKLESLTEEEREGGTALRWLVPCAETWNKRHRHEMGQFLEEVLGLCNASAREISEGACWLLYLLAPDMDEITHLACRMVQDDTYTTRRWGLSTLRRCYLGACPELVSALLGCARGPGLLPKLALQVLRRVAMVGAELPQEQLQVLQVLRDIEFLQEEVDAVLKEFAD
ncbi:unnamed protein product [Effrenium voratum]|nr:unnamed protein product [Effrenium voratum]|mmetsp:Transcript_121014/g.287473  ORF Transcript_121014/g.287473 Transcript_121014/m.287473 type:complete len:237 (-) Transcript_121014:107-817(-)